MTHASTTNPNSVKTKPIILATRKGTVLKPVIKSIEMLDLDDEEDPDSEPENFENICVTELTNMETDFKKWQKLMFSAYQNQAQLFFKVRNFNLIRQGYLPKYGYLV